MTLNYHNTFDDYRQALRGHRAARDSAALRWTVVVLAVALGAWLITLALLGRPHQPTPTIGGPPGPATRLGDALLELARALTPIAPWILVIVFTLGMAAIRQRAPKERVIDVVGRTKPWRVSWGGVVVGVLAIDVVGDLILQSGGGGLESFLWAMVPWLVVMLVLWLFVFRRLVRRAYAAQQSKLERPVTTTITADRVTFDDVLTTLSYRWPAFVRCVESADLFLLYTTEVTFFIIPKRAFASAEDMHGFRQRVADWAQSRSAGFPVLPVPVVAVPVGATE